MEVLRQESLSEQNRLQENIQGLQSELDQTKEEIEKKIENINNLQSQIDLKTMKSHRVTKRSPYLRSNLKN